MNLYQILYYLVSLLMNKGYALLFHFFLDIKKKCQEHKIVKIKLQWEEANHNSIVHQIRKNTVNKNLC